MEAPEPRVGAEPLEGVKPEGRMFCDSEFAVMAWAWVPNVGLSGLFMSKNGTEVLALSANNVLRLGTCRFKPSVVMLGLAVVLGWLATFGIDCADRKWVFWLVVSPSIPTDILVLLVGVSLFDGDALTSASPVWLWDALALMRDLADCAATFLKYSRVGRIRKAVGNGP